MEINPIQMYEASEGQSDNKENIVLRTLVGDPNRHTPLADHRSTSSILSQEKQDASMYTLQTRYQPIPTKVLPKNSDPRVYYIDSQRTQESPSINEHRSNPLAIQPETQSIIPTGFLAPKVISQPVFYSIIGAKNTPIFDDQSIPIKKETPPPKVYAINGRNRRPTVDMNVNNLEVPTPIIDQSPTLYSLVGTPRLQNQIEEPTNQYLQSTPKLYSIIGSPARTSRGVQVNTLDSTQPVPILYTIVGDTPIQTDRSIEKRPPPIKNQPTDVTVYTLGNTAIPPKVQQQQQQQQQQQIIEKPSFYSLVDKSNPPPKETRTKPTVRKETSPPTTTITTQYVSRSLERKQESVKEEIISYPITKNKEPKIPKSEAIYIPLDEQEQRPRPQISRQPPPIHISPEQIQHKPYTIQQNQPIQLPDYRSPYANKPYRERKYNNNPLPVISNNQSDRKSRPPLYEPRYRVEKYQPFTPIKPTSLERYPVNTKPSSNLWDNGYQTQTDDDEEYEQKINKKKIRYKSTRPRAPWIPVW